MNKILSATVIAAILGGASVAYGYNPAATEPGITIEFNEPENFTDFRTSPANRASDREYLMRQMRNEVNRAARQHLPPGYQLSIRINDIDMAGEFRPEYGPHADRVRIMSDIHPPRVVIEYALADAEGNVIDTGSRVLTDRAYNFMIQRPHATELRHETRLVRQLVRELSRKVS